MSREGALWIGGLEPYMDETFLMASIQATGEEGLLSVKVIRNKFTGEPATYGFINFDNDHNALIAMHKLNGKLIPNSSPPIRFKLNHNSTRLMPGEKDCSIWVGDLTPDVDDLQLYQFFSARFQTIRSAKVVLDASGFSKGYGFIRFGNEQEQQTALVSMMGVSGLGAKPIKVSLAVPKSKTMDGLPGSSIPVTSSGSGAMPASSSEADYSQYWQNQYSQYWSQYAAWSQYSQYYDQSGYYAQQGGAATSASDAVPAGELPGGHPSRPGTNGSVDLPGQGSVSEGDDFSLIDHTPKLDYEVLNSKYLTRSEELWSAMEASFWSQEIPSS